MNEILRRLEETLKHYDASVPSLFCDEHSISSQMEHNLPDQQVITDSIFRLKRIPRPDHTTTLSEIREIQSVNGRQTASQGEDGPTLVSGMFEGGLAVVSLSQMACMNYSLRRIDRRHSTDPYVVRFSTYLTPQNSSDCFLQEESKGQAFIDPVSMHVTHLEITTPRHIIIDGTPTSRVVGKRVLTVDYAPVSFGDGTFWMPTAITMRNTSGFGFNQIVWSFRASYRNYHLQEVTSRILPG